MENQKRPDRVVTHLGLGKLNLFGPPALEINCATVIPLYSSYTTALQALCALFISLTNTGLGINFLFSRSVNSFKFSSLGGTFSETFFPVFLKWNTQKITYSWHFHAGLMHLQVPFPVAKFVKFEYFFIDIINFGIVGRFQGVQHLWQFKTIRGREYTLKLLSPVLFCHTNSSYFALTFF